MNDASHDVYLVTRLLAGLADLVTTVDVIVARAEASPGAGPSAGAVLTPDLLVDLGQGIARARILLDEIEPPRQ